MLYYKSSTKSIVAVPVKFHNHIDIKRGGCQNVIILFLGKFINFKIALSKYIVIFHLWFLNLTNNKKIRDLKYPFNFFLSGKLIKLQRSFINKDINFLGPCNFRNFCDTVVISC